MAWKGKNAGKTNLATDVSTGQFKTMGTSATGWKAAPVGKNEKLVRRNNAKGGFMEGATAVHRPGIQERMGAQLHPTATLYAPNAAEAGMVQRNTRIVPSRVGQKDNFYTKRQYGQIFQ